MNDFLQTERRRRNRRTLILFATLFVLVVPASVYAYVGPGAGIALATTAFALLSTVFVVMFGLLFWPARWAYRTIKMDRPPKPAKIKRAVVIGLDGIDPRRVRRLIEEDRLPNMAKLADQGTISDLGTTFPAMSPVAWSSFSTGVNPGKHGIYDFLTRDPKSYLPDLSSADVRGPARHITIGKWRLPIGKPRVRLLKKSRSFWNVLSAYGIPSAILRVPITFPPDRFDGQMLSAMCVPDLQGSQGTFTHIVQKKEGDEEHDGEMHGEVDDPYAVGATLDAVRIADGVYRAELVGPPNPLDPRGQRVTSALDFHVDRDQKKVVLELDGEKIELSDSKYTDWTEIAFKVGLGIKLRGICRIRLLELDPLRVYVSPINIDPERPLLPISHPNFFATFLAKLMGRFATLGFAEDTWALNEGVIDDDAFLEQAWLNHDERERMMFEVLHRTKKGLVTCVYDGTDRIQHMFYRYSDPGHPALRGKDETSHRDVIDETYEKYDEMLGRVFEEVDITDPQNLLIVMSDHGFESFRRGVNVNAWLHDNGYLALRDDQDVGPWFRGVDWHNTKAFGVGLGGIFLNIKGREEHGIVEPDDAEALAREIAEKLEGLVDTDTGDVAIQKMYVAHDIYEGPYLDEAPSLIVGYSAGYRASWDGARGVCAGVTFDDNEKPWSGDHCIDPTLVPGVLMSNRKLHTDETTAIIDVAPTVLDLFGIPTPRYMDGKSLAEAKVEA